MHYRYTLQREKIKSVAINTSQTEVAAKWKSNLWSINGSDHY